MQWFKKLSSWATCNHDHLFKRSPHTNRRSETTACRGLFSWWKVNIVISTDSAGWWVIEPSILCTLGKKNKKKANTLLARSACTPSADKTCSLQSDTILPSTKRRTPSKIKEPFLFLFFSFSAVLHWGGKKSEIVSNTTWKIEKCLSSCTLQHQYTGVIATLDLHTEFGTLLIYICIWLHNVMAVQ